MQLLLCEPLPFEDKAWAVRKVVEETSAEVPVGDRCEECWKVYETAFRGSVSWEQFVKNIGSDKDARSAFQEAKRYMNDSSARPWEPTCVQSSVKTWIEMQKHYIAVTAKDLKKELQVKKLPKSLVQGLPMVKTTSMDGSIEECYLFLHPQQPFRTCVLKTSEEMASTKLLMDSQNHVYAQQAFN
eukprot:4113761-Amphidinium_carterae.1